MKLHKHMTTCVLLVIILMLMPIQTLAKDSIKHSSQFKGYVKEKGIDVSEWQGTINWKKVADDEVTFAIIRVAHRDPESGEILTDKKAIKNLKGAKEAGLKVGAYIFSQATTTEEAKEEAEYADGVISKSGVELDLPLVMDFEYMSTWYGNSGRLYNAWLSKKEATNVVTAFFEVAEDKGYQPMIYANTSMLKNNLIAADICEIGQIWIAEYEEKASYKGTYSCWQYTSSGSVSGIKGRVDLDYRYYKADYKLSDEVKVDTTVLTKSETTFDTLTLSWDAVEEASGYYIERYDPLKTSFVRVKTLENGKLTSWTDTRVNAEAPYTYRIQAFRIEDNMIGISEYSETLSIKTGESEEGVILASDVYVRKQGKMSGDVVCEFDKKTIVKLVGGYGDWYKILKTYEDEVIVGYVYKDLVGFSKDLPEATTAEASTKNFHSVEISWNVVDGAKGYIIQRCNAKDKQYENIVTIGDPEAASYVDSDLDANTKYLYRVIGYTVIKDYQITGGYSEEVAAKTKASVTGYLKVQTGFREEPSTLANMIKKLKPGKKLNIIGASGDFYKVKITVDGEKKTGYVLKKYVKLKK